MNLLPLPFDPSLADHLLLYYTGITRLAKNILEQVVRIAPEQYWWVHRRWRDNRRAKSSQKLAA